MSFSIIPIRELDAYTGRPETILIDLRKPTDFVQGHIAGAKNIPYEQWQIEKEKWRHNYDTVVFYCQRGNQSMYAAKEMNKRGYHAISIAGGYQGYLVYEKQKGKETLHET
nr:rhodanese-like domain-containing protein [Eubacterium sp.]